MPQRKTYDRPAEANRSASALNEETLRSLIHWIDIPSGILVWRADSSLCLSNERAAEIAGRPIIHDIKAAQAIAECRVMLAGTTELYPPLKLLPPSTFQGARASFTDAEIERPDGHRRAIEGWTAPIYDPSGRVDFALTMLIDVTERQQTETLRSAGARLLEMVTAGKPLDQTLDVLCRIFEAQADGMLASILLIQGGKVWYAAAPKLPAGLIKLIDGESVGSNCGSSETAVYLKETVLAADIATDDRWEAYRAAALEFGLRVCWSIPLINSDGEVLGTFTLYYQESREPTQRLLDLAAHASNLAVIAIQLHRQHEALQESQRHLSLIYDHSSDVMFHLAVEEGGYRFVSVNRAFEQATGVDRRQVIGKLAHEVIPEPSRSIVLQNYDEAFRSRKTVRIEGTIPYATGARIGDIAISPVFDAGGHPRYAIGSVRDITDQRLMAEELRQLREREQQHAILDAAPSAVSITRGDIVRYSNRKAVEIFGVRVGDDANMAYVDPRQREHVMAAIAAGQSLLDYEVQLYSANGTILDLLATYRPIIYEDQPSVLTDLVDVSGLKRAERKLKEVSERLQMATRAASVGIWCWDITKNHLEWDEVMHRLYGITGDGFAGTCEAWLARVHPEDLPDVQEFLLAALRGDFDFDAEFRVVWTDGTVRYFKGNGIVQRDVYGKPVQMIGTNWDITEAKNAEEALRTAKQAAEKASIAKSTFLTNMSHDIRTPMNSILGFSQILLRDRSLAAGHRQQLEIIHRSGQHLLGLINDVLDIAKIEAGRLVPASEPFDIHSTIRDLEAMFRERASSANLSLAFTVDASVPQFVITDEGKLLRILINILGNALKFTSRGQVALKAAATPLDRGRKIRLRFDIEDTGRGMAEEELAEVFTPFVQFKRKLTSETGTGLGMPIARDLARMLGGDITVQSRVGIGSVFTTEIVAEVPDQAVSGPRQCPGRVVGIAGERLPPLVLIVDDDERNRALLKAFLLPVGLRVVEAFNGLEALDRFRSLRPDAILMDIRMPIMDGLEATGRIKAEPGGTSTPIIAITASALEEDRQKFLTAGADDFLRKPIEEELLWKALGHALKLEWLREGDGEPETSTTYGNDTFPDPQVIEKLNPELVGKLRDAIEICDVRMAISLLDTAIACDPVVLGRLREMMENYEFEALGEIFRDP